MKRVPTVDEKLCTGCGLCEYHCPVLPDHSIVIYTFQEDREFNAPSETPMDGFFRKNWNERKESGKDEEYKSAKIDFDKRANLMGPGAPTTPGSGK